MYGDPKQLLHPTDSDGRICGEGDLVDKPYLFSFDLTKCIKGFSSVLDGCPTQQVCVKNCPNTTFSTFNFLMLYQNEELIKEKLICRNDSLKSAQIHSSTCVFQAEQLKRALPESPQPVAVLYTCT
ncbi:choline transporter-like protein 1 [Tachypleus tridentatus]|uniref:choline transporter-like protein 1 n=1 Tax=Tachypleus tridentatus TaxID=6853 RepID=UPI003FCEEBF7